MCCFTSDRPLSGTVSLASGEPTRVFFVVVMDVPTQAIFYTHMTSSQVSGILPLESLEVCHSHFLHHLDPGNRASMHGSYET